MYVFLPCKRYELAGRFLLSCKTGCRGRQPLRKARINRVGCGDFRRTCPAPLCKGSWVADPEGLSFQAGNRESAFTVLRNNTRVVPYLKEK